MPATTITRKQLGALLGRDRATINLAEKQGRLPANYAGYPRRWLSTDLIAAGIITEEQASQVRTRASSLGELQALLGKTTSQRNAILDFITDEAQAIGGEPGAEMLRRLLALMEKLK